MADTHANSIYLGPDGKLAVREVTETYVPEGSQSLVRVQYSGVNPCDLNFSYIGLNNFITGFELSGTVVETGPTSPFKVGDAVCGISPIGFPQLSSVGTHQDLAIAEANLLYAVPAGLQLKDAGGIAMASQTASDALFNELGFGLSEGNVSGTDPKGHPILIWGGASNVGSAAIQIAKSAGFNPIFATASPKNHDELKRLGATHCFDYRSPLVVDDIQAATKELGVSLTTAFDTVGKGSVPGEQNTPALTKAALSGATPEDLNLVCTLPIPSDKAFKNCTSYRPSGSIGAMGTPQDPEAPIRVRKAMEYFLASYERVVKISAVTVVKGAEAGIREIERVARGGASMEKVVIEHPL
ncbi:hypothetical protein AK830_g3852 [Neonectria ditissima]|uniref:Enoyl reductase (ER) domain-containing protein n=1 Tax=Neonectria ditissima TaxID=78410 RepID=A0A0P7AXI3_9HYPO|nr:hypothetical protein AK830_g3852 [Neonectria ditissima]